MFSVHDIFFASAYIRTRASAPKNCDRLCGRLFQKKKRVCTGVPLSVFGSVCKCCRWWITNSVKERGYWGENDNYALPGHLVGIMQQQPVKVRKMASESSDAGPAGETPGPLAEKSENAGVREIQELPEKPVLHPELKFYFTCCREYGKPLSASAGMSGIAERSFHRTGTHKSTGEVGVTSSP